MYNHTYGHVHVLHLAFPNVVRYSVSDVRSAFRLSRGLNPGYNWSSYRFHGWVHRHMSRLQGATSKMLAAAEACYANDFGCSLRQLGLREMITESRTWNSGARFYQNMENSLLTPDNPNLIVEKFLEKKLLPFLEVVYGLRNYNAFPWVVTQPP